MIKSLFLSLALFLVIIFLMPCMSNTEGLFKSELFLKRGEFASFAFDHGTMKPIDSLPKGVLNMLNIEIGHYSIGGVLSKLGDAYLSKEYGESGKYALCYRSMKPMDNTVLIFEFGPSGGWDIVDGFSLLQNNSPVFKKCIPSAYVSSDVKLNAGLRLGMTEDELSAIMEMPSAIRGEWRGYIYTGKRKIKERQFDVIVSIIIRIINSKVVEIWVSRGEWS
jgi:hypothetical protein